jgi:hypothetical protein
MQFDHLNTLASFVNRPPHHSLVVDAEVSGYVDYATQLDEQQV